MVTDAEPDLRQRRADGEAEGHLEQARRDASEGSGSASRRGGLAGGWAHVPRSPGAAGV